MSNKDNIVLIKEDLNTRKSEAENIKNMIYTIRGKQVILDSDIAKLYEIETKKLNQAVKRNKQRFPKEFCFQLTEIETENLRSQIVTSSLKENNYGGRRYLPYVFTEQGVAMLSSVLRSKKAIQTNIQIMNTFVKMRQCLGLLAVRIFCTPFRNPYGLLHFGKMLTGTSSANAPLLPKSAIHLLYLRF